MTWLISDILFVIAGALFIFSIGAGILSGLQMSDYRDALLGDNPSWWRQFTLRPPLIFTDDIPKELKIYPRRIWISYGTAVAAMIAFVLALLAGSSLRA